jgi:hypothetical protein
VGILIANAQRFPDAGYQGQKADHCPPPAGARCEQVAGFVLKGTELKSRRSSMSDTAISKKIKFSAATRPNFKTGNGRLLPWVLAIATAALVLHGLPAGAQQLSPDQARAIAKEAVIFGFPLVDSYRIQYSYFIERGSPAYVGSRATGNDEGRFLFAGPNWKGATPLGIKSVIRSETEFAFVLYRTQLFNPGDIDNVKNIQAGYTVQPLSQFLGRSAPDAPPAVEFSKPLSPEAEGTSPEFFNLLNFVLRFCPPNPAETEITARFAALSGAPLSTAPGDTGWILEFSGGPAGELKIRRCC